MTAAAPGAPMKLWDWPVRLTHWGFALILPAQWLTFKAGRMELHETFGFVALGLLLFRLLWGFIGSSPARFTQFVKGPRAIAGYARGLAGRSSARSFGHNPLGALSVLLLLGLLGAQLGFGLFAQDTDGIVSGPLASFVSYDTADWARDWHETIFNLLLIVVALHVAAILFYAIYKRDNLVMPMIVGRKAVDGAAVEPARFVPWPRAVVALLVAGAVAWWVSQGCPGLLS